MAGETSQLSRIAYQKLKNSDENMSWGLEDLEQRAIFCVIRKYITSPNYGEEEAKKHFLHKLKMLDFRGDDEHR